jgi:hypothetical protein
MRRHARVEIDEKSRGNHQGAGALVAARTRLVLFSRIMGRLILTAAVMFLAGCGSDEAKPNTAAGGMTSGMGGSGSSGSSSSNGGSKTTPSGGAINGAAGRGYPDAFDPNDSPPQIGGPGCGFETAAFCDTFGGVSTIRGRAGELDAVFWSGSRSASQISTTRAMGIGMAQLPECRPGAPTQVFPDDDSLICDPTFDVKSGHLLVGVAAQNYGQNGYRIRQPMDFTGRTGKIVFDASTDPLGPLHGWVSLAITEDPISTPGYSIQPNDEGSIIPKNALEIHFANAGGMNEITVRNIHVFNNYVDTVYSPPGSLKAATHVKGKANHFEVLVSQDNVEVRVSPSSDDGVTFGEATLIYSQPVSLPMSRGYVHLSVHNHATIKYTQPDSGADAVVDATIARLDNVGFDGPVITNWREYEVPDALVKFKEVNFQEPPDPYNPDASGVDIGYAVQDTAKGPAQVLHFTDVDPQDAVSARLATSFWVDFNNKDKPPSEYTLQARFNGGAWLSRKLNAEEAKFFGDGPDLGPTTLDPEGKPFGNPGTQGRLALMFDVPLTDLVAGDNTVEFVTSNAPTAYPPVISNIDLIMQTK